MAFMVRKVILPVIVLVIGFLLGYILGNSSASTLRDQIAVLQGQVNSLQADKARLTAENQMLRKSIANLQSELEQTRVKERALQSVIENICRGVADLRAIVYILPSRASSSAWRDMYGDRIYFYVYADLRNYADQIRRDFTIISRVYNTLVIVIPAEDSERFLENLRLVDSLAQEAGLRIMWAIFPKWKYGPESSYLEQGTPMNKLVLSLMEYLSSLNSTWKIAVWYGWPDRADPADIMKFYDQLPCALKLLYAAWLDEEYAEVAKRIVQYDPPFFVVTELYSDAAIANYSGLLRQQIVVTGYYGATTPEEWLEGISRKVALIKGESRHICIWMFYDIGDGHNEIYAAYRPEWGAIPDPYKKKIIRVSG